MSVEFDRRSPGKFDSRTLNREVLIGGLGVVACCVCVCVCVCVPECSLTLPTPRSQFVRSSGAEWGFGMFLNDASGFQVVTTMFQPAFAAHESVRFVLSTRALEYNLSLSLSLYIYIYT